MYVCLYVCSAHKLNVWINFNQICYDPATNTVRVRQPEPLGEGVDEGDIFKTWENGRY